METISIGGRSWAGTSTRLVLLLLTSTLHAPPNRLLVDAVCSSTIIYLVGRAFSSAALIELKVRVRVGQSPPKLPVSGANR